MPIKVLSVFGTRPDAIKMCPPSNSSARTAALKASCASARSTGNARPGARDFRRAPDYDLDIMKPSQTLFQISAAMIPGLGDVLGK